MRESELRKRAKCNLCGKLIGHTGLPLFWTVRIERYGIDMAAVRRQTGLTMMLGGHVALAAAMGPDEEMATRIGDAVTLTVCERCAVSDHPRCIAEMAEGGGNG